MTALSFFKDWYEYRRFQRLGAPQRDLVFYSESASYWLHLKPVMQGLLDNSDISFCYVSSAIDDPGLTYAPERIHSFCIGKGFFRTLWFTSLRTKVLAMTMPDLETFHIKRSRLAPVYYVYIHHSPVSTHMIYRPGAFDHFDEIFCVGPHHEKETRVSEDVYGTPKKKMFRHGYGRLDDLISHTAAVRPSEKSSRPLWVTIAPSWGENGILETCGKELIEILLAEAFQVTVRPHPRTSLIAPRIIENIRSVFGSNPLFNIEDDARETASINCADIMISDWSGVAFDFAFARLRPVLFLDTPRKMNNMDYESLGIEPLEVTIRSAIGEVLATDNLPRTPETVRKLCSSPAAFAIKIRQARDMWIYNVGKSGKTGAQRILELCTSNRSRE